MIYFNGKHIPVTMRRFDTHWCAVAVAARWYNWQGYLEILWWQSSLGKYGLNEHLLYKA